MLICSSETFLNIINVENSSTLIFGYFLFLEYFDE